MIGVIVNTLTVLAGSAVGLLAKKAIPKDWTDFIFKGIALCVLYIGCLLYTSPSPRDRQKSRMPSSA